MRFSSNLLSQALKRGIAPNDPRFVAFATKHNRDEDERRHEDRIRAIMTGNHFRQQETPFTKEDLSRLPVPTGGREVQRWTRGNLERAIVLFGTRTEYVFERRGLTWQRVL